MKFESNTIDIISIKSENYKARFVADFYELENPAEEKIEKLKDIFETTMKNNEDLPETEKFEKALNVISENCPATIKYINMEVSNEICEEKPIYEHFNKYCDMLFDKVENHIFLDTEPNLKESPYMFIEKGQGKYTMKYKNKGGECYVTAFDSGHTSYDIDGDITISDMKFITNMVKNINMDSKFDKSGKPKNYEVTPADNKEMVITVSKNNKNYEDYETSINILSRDDLEQTRSYIKTEIPADNEKLLESILKISDEITDYCGTEQFITEFSEKILKELSEIKKDISEIPNNIEIQTDFHGEPHKIFSQILSENIDSDCNIKVTQNCTDTQFSYRNTGELSVTMDENIDTRISFSTDDINKNVTISYYGDMSDSFKKECVKNLEEMSNTAPQLSKINDYVIENIKHNKTFEKDIDI